MAKVQKNPCEIQNFLNMLTSILKTEEHVIINDDEWADGRVNKTRAYMAETGIKRADIIEVLKKLKVSNYAYTEEDRNKNYAGQEFWFFGIRECLVDKLEHYYIKLKIRQIDDDYLLVMSFHPEQPAKPELKLTFPYD